MRGPPRVPSRRGALLGEGERAVALVGAFGSGKTEVAVSLALELAGAGAADAGAARAAPSGRPTVRLADLDLVNPYFRSREARVEMEARGVEVIVPRGAWAWADLPIVLPEVGALLRPPEGTVSILDLGGDDVGARVLGSLGPPPAGDAFALWQVVNARRPSTSTVNGALEVLREIEAATRLRVTGLVGNTHLLEETTPETVLSGWRFLREVSGASGVPLRCIAGVARVLDELPRGAIDVPLLRMERRMLPPWLPRQDPGTRWAAASNLPSR